MKEKKTKFSERTCKRPTCEPQHCVTCPERFVHLKRPKVVASVVKAHPVMNALQELHELDQSIKVQRCSIKYYRELLDPELHAEKMERLSAIVAKAQREYDEGLRANQEALADIAAAEQKIARFERRKKVLKNKKGLDALAKMRVETAAIAAELREKGLPVPE
jgi:hypothetical protein